MMHLTCRLLLSEVETSETYRALRAGEIDVLVTWLVIDEADLVAGPVLDWLPRVLARRRTPLAIEKVIGVDRGHRGLQGAMGRTAVRGSLRGSSD